MALTAGTRLGVYEVTAQIGEGGMGQVFLAHDAKLNRDIALKILPDSFANDPDRLMRFTRGRLDDVGVEKRVGDCVEAERHGQRPNDGQRDLWRTLEDADANRMSPQSDSRRIRALDG